MFFTFFNSTLLNASYNILTANPPTDANSILQNKTNKELQNEIDELLKEISSYANHETNIYALPSFLMFKHAVQQLFKDTSNKGHFTEIQTIGKNLIKEATECTIFSTEIQNCVQRIITLAEYITS